MDFHVLTPAGPELLVRVVDGRLVIVPAPENAENPCVKRPDRHSANESENGRCFTQKPAETRMDAELGTGL